jgi:hypothetical protein
MASKKAREFRREFRKNGFIIVDSMRRTYKKMYGRIKLETVGREKMEVDVPEKATSKTHPHLYTMSVKQQEATSTKFKVVRGKNNLVTIHRKNGSGLKLMRTYYWSGRKLHLLSLEGYMRKGVMTRVSEDLFRLDLPRLTHEQCVDVENVLIRL